MTVCLGNLAFKCGLFVAGSESSESSKKDAKLIYIFYIATATQGSPLIVSLFSLFSMSLHLIESDWGPVHTCEMVCWVCPWINMTGNYVIPCQAFFSSFGVFLPIQSLFTMRMLKESVVYSWIWNSNTFHSTVTGCCGTEFCDRSLRQQEMTHIFFLNFCRNKKAISKFQSLLHHIITSFSFILKIHFKNISDIFSIYSEGFSLEHIAIQSINNKEN